MIRGSIVEAVELFAAVEQTADSIVVTDTTGKIRYVNPAFTAMTGYSAEEAAGKHTSILNSGRQSGSFYADLWNSIASGRVWQGDLVNRRKDGSLYNEEMTITPVRDERGQITTYIAIKRDITARRTAEEAQGLLAAIVESSADAIMAYTPAGILLTWNRGAENMFGYSAEEAVGKSISILMLPERVPIIPDFVEKILRNNPPPEYETTCLHKDGRRIAVSVTSSPIRNSTGQAVAVSVILRDISERQAAEQARAVLASIVESSEDAIYSTTLSGEIVTWNRGAEALFGYAAVEIVGEPAWILAPPERHEEVRRSLNSVMNGVSVGNFETVRRRKDGTLVEVSITVSSILNSAGTPVNASAIVRDIGERKRAERKLEESDDRFRKVFEHAPFGLCITGLDARFIDVNTSLCRILGYSQQELVDEDWRNLTHPDDLALSEQAVRRLCNDPGACVDFEKRYIHRSGATVWTRLKLSMIRNSAGDPQYSIVHVEDITESKRAKEALCESEDRFRIMADGCPSPMWVTDANGANQFINRAYRETMDAAYEQVEGDRWQLILHPEDAKAYIEAFKRAIRDRSSFSAEARVLAAGGRWRWVASYAQPRFSPDGGFLGFVGLSPDITDYKVAEQARQFQHSLVRAIHEVSLDGILVVNDANIIVSHNKRFLNVWKIALDGIPDNLPDYAADQGPGLVLAEALSRVKDPVAFLNRIQELNNTPDADDHREIELKDGRTLERYSTGLRSDQGRHLGRVWFFRDITERKQAEKDIVDAREFAKATIDALSSHVCVLDETGAIIAVNKAWKIFAEKNRSSLDVQGLGEGVNYIDVCDRARGPDSAEATLVAAGIRAVLAGEQGQYSTEYACHAPGEPRWFITRITRFLSSSLPRILVEHINITARKLSEQALQASEEKFRQLAENTHEVFWMMTPDAGEMLYISPAYKQVWGRTTESLYANPMSWIDAIHPDDLARSHDAFKRQMAGERIDSEYRINTPGGEEKWICDRAFPIFNDANQVTRIVGIAEEVTDRKRYEAELIRAREGAESANLAKSRFLANMSHEIRTPMNGVIGMTQLLLNSHLTAEQRRFAEVVQTSGRSLLALIDDILDLSKIEARKVVLENLDFDPRRAIDEVVQLLRPQATAKGLGIEARISPLIPAALRGDPFRLRQILTNLSANAIKFTERGSVSIVASFVSKDLGQSTIRFTVTDTGIGIRPDQAAKLFAPFVQADASTTRRYGGTGLGLAICKQLVEMMGGTIGIDSQEGQGSAFWFAVPFERASPSMRVSEKLPLTQTCAAGDAKILVAEDNATNRLVVLAQLKKLGYQATAVVNGAEAVEAVRTGSYDLVLMDCEMPVMDGFEATRQIRVSTHPDIPLIALTASAMQADRERCIREGMSDYLSKPVDLGHLAQIISKWLPSQVTVN